MHSGVVRVWLQPEDCSDKVGHLAQVQKHHPDRGLRVNVWTTASSDGHWLQPEQQGFVWNWLQNLKVRGPRRRGILRSAGHRDARSLHMHR